MSINSDVISAYLLSNPSNSSLCSLCCRKYSQQNISVEYTTCHEVICRECYFEMNEPKRCMVCGRQDGKYDLKSPSLQYIIKVEQKDIITLNFQDQDGKTIQVSINKKSRFEQLMNEIEKFKSNTIKTLIKQSKAIDVQRERKNNKTLGEMGFQDGERIILSKKFIGGSIDE